ncbi:MAG: Npt1/Npt2 family nucleotide transporter [Elusimicrobiota bacterium]
MAAISAAAMFLVGGYEFVRSASTSLFIEAYGAKNLPYAMTAIPPVLALLVYLYGRLLSKFGAMRALAVTTLFSSLVFIACYFALAAGHKSAAAALYVFRQAYIVLIIEQYWSLINSTLKPEQAKLYNGPIIGGASIGPILGGLILNRCAESLGTETFILLAAAVLVPAAILSYAAYRLTGEPQPQGREKDGSEGHVNLGLFARSRTLVLIAAIVALTQIVSTCLSLRFYDLLETSIAVKDARTAYLGGFWSTANGFSSVLQFILTPLILSRTSLRWVHLGMPVIHIAAAAALFAHPALPVAATSLILFKGFDYSLFRAAKEILYIPLSFDARFRAKQVIDAFTYRFSKGATGAVVAVATAALGKIPGPVYPAAAGLAALVWAGLALPLTREAPES